MLVLVITGAAADYLGAKTTRVLREWNQFPRFARRLARSEQECRAVEHFGGYVGVEGFASSSCGNPGVAAGTPQRREGAKTCTRSWI